ncbi:MAG TPA: amino acid adenylation domain-containing protein [Jatrophihabitans sp.]|nr:amino acid adenylation domain-containing protein [Jatrophihabitans sp.]
MLSQAQRQALAVQFRAQQLAGRSTLGRRPAGLAEIPLSYAQEQLWFLDRLAPGLPTYNVPAQLRLTGALDVPALRSALRTVLARHEALRTRFVEGPHGAPVLLIDPPGALPLPVVELPGADALAALAAAAATEPFELARGPLFRCQLVRLAEDEHVLLIVVHHIVFDAWSFDVLVRELAALYTEAVTGEPAGLAELPVQFADYAYAERQQLAESGAELVDYWRSALAGFSQLQLPTDRPRPVLESFRGGIRRHRLGEQLAEGVRELSRRHDTTPFVVLLAALHAVLARYTGQRDIVVGVPSANRGRSSLQPLIGFLVNTLPIRAELAGDPAFGQLLEQLRRTTVAGYAHQGLPFAKLVEAIGVERDPGRSPVFSVLLTGAEAPGEVAAADLTIRLERVDLPAAKFDLAFFAEFCPDGLWLEVTYASDLFDAETIDRMLLHYGELLAGALADPARRLSELPLLSEEELFAELIEWNSTATELPGRTVHQLFDDQLRRTPDAPAVVSGGTELSYAELGGMANRLAAWLLEHGVRPQSLVGVAMAPSGLRLAVVLAILKAGGGYLPLDPALPADRLSFIVGDAAVGLVVTDRAGELSAVLAGADCLDPAWVSRSAPDPGSPAVPVDESDIAYVIYTSGSTGRPKGVVVEHRQAVNFVLGGIDRWQLGPHDRVLQFASLNFDVSVLDMFCCLLSGATAVVADADTRLSPPRLGALMREHRVSFACLPPAVLGLLADQRLPDLRLLIAGGEALPTEVASAWLRDGLRLVNGYGPTEVTVISVAGEVDGRSWPAPIGRPMPNCQAYVLDPHLNPVPVGVVGELYLGGAAVARGYLNRPELTAERFLDDPFGPDPDGRLYRTGDLVKRLPDGRLVFLGRADGQVKLRGLRIELGEIESALARHPAIDQAVVQLEQDAAGERFLAGYLRPAPGGGRPEPASVAEFLGRWLPGYMIPARLVWLDEFPLNPSGKVDRRALSARLAELADRQGRPAAGEVDRQPVSSTEAVLVRIYAELLRTQRCGVLDSFFDAGGNSLQAMQLISRVRAELGVDLPLTAVFLAPAPRGLAARIDAERAGLVRPAAGGSVVPLSDGAGTDPLFLIHPVGGTVLPYSQLAAELAEDYQVYGIQAPALGTALGTASPPVAGTIAELAAGYLAEVRAVQPIGPYRIGGWSMGGLLAHELVRQLEQAGESVELMVLIDAPFAVAGEPGDARPARQFVADALRSLGLPAARQPDSDEVPVQLACLLAALDPAPDQRAATAEELDRRLAVFTEHRRLMAGYRPAGTVRADTLLISAEHSPNAAVQDDWADMVTGNLRRAGYDTDHYGLLRLPHVRDLARHLRAGTRIPG